jgi:hypothetical protein
MWYPGKRIVKRIRTKKKTAQGLMEIGRLVSIQMENNRPFRNQLKRQGLLVKIDRIMYNATK